MQEENRKVRRLSEGQEWRVLVEAKELKEVRGIWNRLTVKTAQPGSN